MAKKARAEGVLTQRALNRATLSRQMLLSREKSTPLRAVERLLGLQAQIPRPPFIALWSRIQGFQRDDLKKALLQKQIVRSTTMRCTIHLISTTDFLAFRSTLQPALDKALGVVKKSIAGMDLEKLVSDSKKYFEKEPRTFEDLREYFLKRDPKAEERAMAYAVRTKLPLIQVPTESDWCYPAQACFAAAEQWLSKKIAPDPKLDQLVLRYLASFGPATPADMQTWSGLPSLKQTFEGLRPKLITFRDENGRELFDLPESPRPDEDTPAPVRFIPDYDNLILGHADRSRLVSDEHRKVIATANLRILATFLVDGRVAGVWSSQRKKSTATIVLSPFATLSKPIKKALEEEAEMMAKFIEPDAGEIDVRFE